MIMMRHLFIYFFCLAAVLPAYTQESFAERKFEVTVAPEMLIYQSAYNFQDSYGIEAAIQGKLYKNIDWQAGLRLGFDPVAPEGFGRLLIGQALKAWHPNIGVEFGVTTRDYFEDGSSLLQETRKAMQEGIWPVYVAVHAAPVKFFFGHGWTVSAMEVDLGTQLSDFGTTLRVRLGLFSIGKRF